MINRRFALILAMLALAGCAHVPEVEPIQPGPELVVAPAKQPDLPKQKLSEDILFEFLVSEVAGQRGRLDLAAGGLLDLAKKTRDPRLAKRATEAAMYGRLEPQALEGAKLWLELDPDEAKAQQVVTALLVNGGHLTEAKPYLEKLLAGEEDGRGVDFLHLNQLFAKQGGKPAVLEMVRDLAKPYPGSPEAHFAIAQAAWNAGNADLALQEIQQAARLRPGWEMAALFEGRLRQQASAAQALEFYRNYLRDYPKAQDVRLTYARALVSERRYADALAQFQWLVEAFPDNPDVSMAVGLLSLEIKEYDKAETYLKRALDQHYKDEDALRMYLGQLFEERQQYAEAMKYYEGVAQGEHYFAARIKQASILAKQGKLAEARRLLQQMPVQNNQQRVLAIQAEAQLLRNAKAYQEAFDLLGKGLEKLPNYPDLLYDRAMVAEKLNRLDVMEQDLRKLIQLKPDYAHAYNALGYTFAERNERLEEARQLIEKASKLAPDDVAIMDSMGWVQYRLGHFDQAESYLRRAYGAQPDPEIAAHLGEVLWARGKKGEAESFLRSALQENPGDEALLNAIKKFKP